MMSSKLTSEMKPGETHPPPLTPKQFERTPEFRDFKGIMRRLLAVPKVQLDRKVRAAAKKSSRAGNPNAPGRKKNIS